MSLSQAGRRPRSRARWRPVPQPSPRHRHRRNPRSRSARFSPRPSMTLVVVMSVLSMLSVAGMSRTGYAGVATRGGASATPSAAHLDAVEGRDYSFLSRVDGHPVHWSCDSPIYLVLQGSPPAGAGQALVRAAGMLRGASGLDLQVGPPHSRGAVISIRYGPVGTVAGNLRLDDEPELGVGGPTWSAQDGVIRSGAVLIRDDTPLTDPRTPTGARVLLHEIGHGLGLGHSAHGTPEIMAPTTSIDDSDQLGSGDRAALAAVGCPQR